MATRWHYRRSDAELGPVGFQELINLVRAEKLGTDDLVREEWNPEWRPAALAVGLFHMAGRDDLVARWEAEQEELRRQAEAAQAVADGACSAEEPPWQKRLRELEAERAALEDAEQVERDAELAANATRTEIGENLAAALADLDARERALEPTRLRRLWDTITGRDTAHLLVRWLPTLIVPNLLAFWILQWSEVETQRFPDRQALSSGIRHFPLWGECESGMFFFLLTDSMLFGGLAAYVIARMLEQIADD